MTAGPSAAESASARAGSVMVAISEPIAGQFYQPEDIFWVGQRSPMRKVFLAG
jgi:hypothetical protein